MTLDYDGWIILIGVLAAVACALPGAWLVVRGMGLMGDAISHAVLPGIAIGFMISGTRSGGWMFAGAAISGVAAALLSQVVHRWGRVEHGAAMGLVFTAFFSLGLLLIVQTADTVDLDVNCVLYGAIEMAPLDVVTIAGWPMEVIGITSMDVPRIVIPLTVMVLINLLVIVVLYKELLLSAFDASLSSTQGFDARWLHYGVMALTAATCVACFEAVGSIITVALIVAPPAAALLLSRRMSVVLLISVVIGGAAAVLGHLSAITLPGLILGRQVDTSSAGMMAVMAAVLFVIVAMVAPQRGVVSRWIFRRRQTARIAVEDALGLLFRLQERAITADAEAVTRLLHSDVRVGPRRAAGVLSKLRRKSLAALSDGRWVLTNRGNVEARTLVRAHRLWETYLAGRSSIPSSHLHGAAERLEHVTSEGMMTALSDAVDDATQDPHGRRIPPA